MRQAIRTKFFGPTNSKGSRIQAKCAAKTIYVNWDYSMNQDDNHAKAAKILADQLGWSTFGDYVGGDFENCSYFVQVPQSEKLTSAAPRLFEALERVFQECRLEGCSPDLNSLIVETLNAVKGNKL